MVVWAHTMANIPLICSVITGGWNQVELGGQIKDVDLLKNVFSKFFF